MNGNPAPDPFDAVFARAGEIPQPDPRLPSDPVLTEMVRLSALAHAERDEALEPYLAAWLERGLPALAVATYLAAAGMTLEEAEALVLAVRSRWTEKLARQARAQIAGGLVCLLAAVALVCLGLLGKVVLVPFWLCVVLGLGGMALSALVRGTRLQLRLAPPPEESF